MELLLSALDANWRPLRLVAQQGERPMYIFHCAVVSLLSKANFALFSFVWVANLPNLVERNWVGPNAV